MTSTIYKTWLNRIESGIFTKSQCGQWVAAVVPLSLGSSPRGKRTNLTEDEAVSLMDAMERAGGVRLTAEHTEQGLRWLEKGGARKLSLDPDCFLDFDHFEFWGEGIDIGRGGWAHYVPIWVIVNKDGSIWKYHAASWQSGNSYHDQAWKVSDATLLTA